MYCTDAMRWVSSRIQWLVQLLKKMKPLNVELMTLALVFPPPWHTSSSPYLQGETEIRQSWAPVSLTFMTLNLSVVPVISTTGNKNWNARFVTRLQSCPLLLKTTRTFWNGHLEPHANCRLNITSTDTTIIKDIWWSAGRSISNSVHWSVIVRMVESALHYHGQVRWVLQYLPQCDKNQGV